MATEAPVDQPRDRVAAVASNDDAADDTLDAHVTATLPEGGRHYLVFRDYHLESRRFTSRSSARRSRRSPPAR